MKNEDLIDDIRFLCLLLESQMSFELYVYDVVLPSSNTTNHSTQQWSILQLLLHGLRLHISRTGFVSNAITANDLTILLVRRRFWQSILFSLFCTQNRLSSINETRILNIDRNRHHFATWIENSQTIENVETLMNARTTPKSSTWQRQNPMSYCQIAVVELSTNVWWNCQICIWPYTRMPLICCEKCQSHKIS